MRSHLRGMHGIGGNIATFSYAVGTRLAALRQGHFAVQDDVRRFNGVRVIGIERVWSVLPNISVRKSLTLKLRFQRFLNGRHLRISAINLYAWLSFGRKMLAATRATVRRGTIRTVSAPIQFLKPEITELFPAASAASPTWATF